MDSLKLELLKNKKENAQSAIASQEVREHLAGFIRSKRQGSSNQINNINQQRISLNQTGSTSGYSITTDQAGRVDSAVDIHGVKLTRAVTGVVEMSEDHPLRKTASMPTMHIPYKAKSLSRRRQMERRTTMSPLMRRPKKQLLHTRQANSIDYSSNPCIIQSSRANTRSLSQSNSPPPCSISSISQHQLNITSSSENPAITPSGQETSQSIKLNPIYINSKLDISQSANKSSCSKQQSSGGNINISYNSGNCGNHSIDIMTQRQQQYIKLTESIRNTVIKRVDRGKMATSGSLDTDQCSINPLSAAMKCDVASISTGICSRSNTLSNYRDELRQWSLDGADMKNGRPQSKVLTSPSSGGGMSHIEFHRLRLATTVDAAGIRRSQSPSSSIYMGVPPGLSATSFVKPRAGILNQLKQYSSSSSSTSSLLSAQNSLEDSSSQAIDLSSSSEAGRQRNHNQHSTSLNPTGHRDQSASHLRKSSVTGPGHEQQQCQKALQDLFDKLQLRQSQENVKQVQYLPPHHHHHQQQHYTNPSKKNISECQAAFLDANKSITNFDSSNQPNTDFITSQLSNQLSLSGSAQNLISLHEQPQLNQMISTSGINPSSSLEPPQRQTDLNQWFVAHKSLIQSPGLQQQNQINGALMAKIMCLPEPYKTSFLAHLMQQQQFQSLKSVPYPISIKHNVQHDYSDYWKTHDHRLLIGRTLSSPLLLNSVNMAKQLEPNLIGLKQSTNTENVNIYDTTIESVADMMISTNCVQTAMDLDEKNPIPRQTFTSMIVDTNTHSLDLTTSSSRVASSNEMSNTGCNKNQTIVKQQVALDFSYTPIDPERSSRNFIYNPIFSQSSSTGLTYELEMCNHKCICGNESNHPESSQRVLAIWRRLYERGLLAKCARIEARKATIEELRLCHSETYVNYFGKSPYERIKLSHLDLSKLSIDGLTQLECGGQGADIDTAWNEEQTPGVARLATGCVIEAAISIATGKLTNAFAIVRPPGHHAEYQQVMGFCFFNSVAIAARILTNKYHISKVLIVDWDVHHGNGIQDAFYEDESVMYISLHRHDRGNFFPGTGDIREIGQGSGEGYNWNIAWSGEIMGDAEYLAAFRSIVMPIACEFNPNIVLVACGFDAARGHPFNFGGYDLSPAIFFYMTRQLMSLANGRLLLCFEGGYQLNTICDCAESCVRALLNESHLSIIDQVSEVELKREPNQSAVEILTAVSSLAEKYWPSVESWKTMVERSALEAANLR